MTYTFRTEHKNGDTTIFVRQGEGKYLPGKSVGSAKLVGGVLPDALVLMSIELNQEARAEGVGTQLYKMAFDEACKQGMTVASDTMRSPYAEAFWRKQQKRGRATCREEGRGGYYGGPLKTLFQDLFRECKKHFARDDQHMKAVRCAEARMKPMVAALPLPVEKNGSEHWPCFQWQLQKQKCGSALDGLPKTRKRKR